MADESTLNEREIAEDEPEVKEEDLEKVAGGFIVQPFPPDYPFPGPGPTFPEPEPMPGQLL